MITATKSIEQAIREFDSSARQDALESAKEQRTLLLERFPRTRWPQMSLEEYALGQSDSADTFCRWMEFRSQALGGIGGGSSRKHIIYKRKKKDGWYFPRRFANEHEAWTQLQREFIQAFDLAERGEWEEIDELELLPSGSALCLKALHLYFPNEVLPIYSRDHLRHFLRVVDPREGQPRETRAVHANRRLLAALREFTELNGLGTEELAHFLYGWIDPKDTHRVVKIAPGEQARYWDDCRDGGYICVGWDQVGDLDEFESKEVFRERFAAEFPYNGQQSSITRKSNELWMLTELEPGDLVVANKGTSKILAIGEVVEPGYQWRDDRQEYKHTVSVKWDVGYAMSIPPQGAWATVTVKKVPDALFELITSNLPKEGGMAKLAIPVDPIYHRIASALERKGQLVLYGPPGTGKTYTARRFAVWWLLRQMGDSRAETVLGDSGLMARCESELSTTRLSGRVWWVVANPNSWSWDQLLTERRVTFSGGRLKKNYARVQRGDLVVGYQSTPDKRVVALARVARESQPSAENEPSIELKLHSLVANGMTYDDLLKDSILSKSEPIRSRCQGTLFALSAAEAEHLISRLVEGDPSLVIEEDSSGGNVGCLTRVTFHPSYTYEDFIEGFRPYEQTGGGLALRLEDGIFKRVCLAAQQPPELSYLILIDELNRGNVAKILGELLTLLERDKRGMTVVLPQSKESFAIPPKVYLLGTMNTADRSIKLLDAALRRRFAFIELMPDLEQFRGATVGELALDEFLEELNRRIARLEGREKQIGHAYLLVDGEPVSEPEEFARCFREEILPLLQEYCYDDFKTLAGFIGSGLVDEDAQSLDHEKLQDAELLITELAAEFAAGVRIDE